MARAQLVLAYAADRTKAHRWVDQAPINTRLEFKQPKRSVPQNDRFWAMLTDISIQVSHHGMRLTPDDWRLLFLDALKREVRIAPNLDGTAFVNLGRSSSDLSKAEFSDIFEVMEAWAASNGVTFHDGRSPDNSPPVERVTA